MPDHNPQPIESELNHDYAAVLAQQCQNRPKGEQTSARIRVAACTLLQRHAPQDLTC